MIMCGSVKKQQPFKEVQAMNPQSQSLHQHRPFPMTQSFLGMHICIVTLALVNPQIGCFHQLVYLFTIALLTKIFKFEKESNCTLMELSLAYLDDF